MIDPELKSHLETVEKELVNLRTSSTSLTSSFSRGIVYGAGYIVGAVVIIIVIGWVLNIVGIIPALSDQVNEFRDALNRIGGPVAK